MTDATARLALPLLASGQAQKEVTSNEAVTRLSFITQASVVAVAPSSVPASPTPGQCWIVGASASGAWAGKDANLACWTANGWRFQPPFDGMTAWDLATSLPAMYVGGSWSVGVARVSQVRIAGVQVLGGRQPAIAAPGGGATVDAEARATILSILSTLRNHGLIAV